MKNTDVWTDDEILLTISPNHTLLVFETCKQNNRFRDWWEKCGQDEFVDWYNMMEKNVIPR